MFHSSVLARGILSNFQKTGILSTSDTGGFLTVLYKNRPKKAHMVAQVGKISNPNEVAKYRKLSQEKANRLWSKTNLEKGHVSSWQSRHPDTERYGGAIHAGDYILSFSGLPELADQALMLTLAVELDLLTYEEACEIARISGDEKYFRALASKLKMS